MKGCSHILLPAACRWSDRQLAAARPFSHVLVIAVLLTVAGCVVDEKCYNDSDCSSSEICKSGNCVGKECDLDSDCTFPAICRQGVCVVECGGKVCPERAHAASACSSGQCVYVCVDGWYDNNRLAHDGCEASGCISAEEECDGRDNDCDCPGDTNGDDLFCGPGDEGVDEGFDKDAADACGPYCVTCDYAHSEALCVDGECRMGLCDADWLDANETDADGCECTATNSGEEICDGIDNDCDGNVDEGGVCGIECPDGMVSVGEELCIDIYEASRPDATRDHAGLDASSATSRAGVLPWMVNPITYDHFLAFASACEAAGKHLCSADEWLAACSGPVPAARYVYGDDFDREVCNCVDTFCDDYCEESGISPDRCNTGTNCGYAYGCFAEVPTGMFLGCTNEYGTFDINGNLWEIVSSEADPRGYEVRGGAFNCASPSVRLQCTYNAGWAELYAGFRCCYVP